MLVSAAAAQEPLPRLDRAVTTKTAALGRERRAWKTPDEFKENAYTCVIHGVGMTDEFPRVNPIFRGRNPYDGVIQAGMVICIESYMGAVGERDGVKLEQQVLVTSDGIEPISTYPWEAEFLE